MDQQRLHKITLYTKVFFHLTVDYSYAYILSRII
jgi:hypothetical protein